jgi:hypothetical protein
MPLQYNENIGEAIAFLGVQPPASLAVGTHIVGPFSMGMIRRIMFLVNVGALGTSATVDFKVQACATQGGTYADVTGTSITQITSGAKNFATVEAKSESLSNNSQGPWVQGLLTVGVAACLVSVECIGSPSYAPASFYNVVTPVQAVVV